MKPRFDARRVRESVSIQRVVEGHGIELKKASDGRLVGLCPFHTEKTASFMVYTESGSGQSPHCHCFGCGWSGDAIKFVMEFSGETFSAALKVLVEQFGADGVEPILTPATKRKIEEVQEWFHKNDRWLATAINGYVWLRSHIMRNQWPEDSVMWDIGCELDPLIDALGEARTRWAEMRAPVIVAYYDLHRHGLAPQVKEAIEMGSSEAREALAVALPMYAEDQRRRWAAHTLEAKSVLASVFADAPQQVFDRAMTVANEVLTHADSPHDRLGHRGGNPRRSATRRDYHQQSAA